MVNPLRFLNFVVQMTSQQCPPGLGTFETTIVQTVTLMSCDTGPLSRAEYLNSIKFPDRSTAPGPSIRAGDFGELLVADYLQYCLGYWVPGTGIWNKTIRNESTKGSDIIGFHFFRDGKGFPKDILAILSKSPIRFQTR